MIDAAHSHVDNIPVSIPKVTGSADIEWTGQDWDRFPHSGKVRIGQSPELAAYGANTASVAGIRPKDAEGVHAGGAPSAISGVMDETESAAPVRDDRDRDFRAGQCAKDSRFFCSSGGIWVCGWCSRMRRCSLKSSRSRFARSIEKPLRMTIRMTAMSVRFSGNV
jgi:hypothetical protein